MVVVVVLASVALVVAAIATISHWLANLIVSWDEEDTALSDPLTPLQIAVMEREDLARKQRGMDRFKEHIDSLQGGGGYVDEPQPK